MNVAIAFRYIDNDYRVQKTNSGWYIIKANSDIDFIGMKPKLIDLGIECAYSNNLLIMIDRSKKRIKDNLILLDKTLEPRLIDNDYSVSQIKIDMMSLKDKTIEEGTELIRLKPVFSPNMIRDTE